MSQRPPIAPRSPRAALEPEQVPQPPKHSQRARSTLVVVGVVSVDSGVVVAVAGVFGAGGDGVGVGTDVVGAAVTAVRSSALAKFMGAS